MAILAVSPCAYLLVVLLPLATPAEVEGAPQLACFYNSRANISCVWSREEGSEATSCRLHAQSNYRSWNVTCELFPVTQDSWACSLILGPPDSQKLTSVDVVNISVVCWEGERWRLVNSVGFQPFEHFRLMAPLSLEVTQVETHTCNISWQIHLVSHYILQELEFEARTRAPGSRWEDAPLLSLRQRQQWIYLEVLTPDTPYEFQVRVRAQRGHHRAWSPWSQPLAFRTKPAGMVGKFLTLPWLYQLLLGLACVFGFLVSVHIVANCGCLGPWLKMALKYHIPDPAKFFSRLNSQHGGDLQKWLSSPFPSSSFHPAEPAPEISPLEVLDHDSKAAQLLPLQQDKAPSPSPSGQSQTSCFTNQGYFFFHLPDALEIEACQVYFTYDPCAEEGMEESVPAGSPLLPLAGENDAYCTLPPGDDLLHFSPGLLSSPSIPQAALGGEVASEARLAFSLQEDPLAPTDPDLVDLQCPLELALGDAGEEVPAVGTEEEAGIPEASPCQQGQDRAPAWGLDLNTDAYLSLQELQAQDATHLLQTEVGGSDCL
uniref:interleukin-2 receptor subunit beta n=1 Tax=Jaculus jaculus TaxID=51337 RepID=UPI001E1B106B|nr:interleukin-2 receptor subunit beta [Jaculus jaculus]